MSTMPDLYPLDGVRRGYAWGSHTAVQSMLGIEPDGSPIAELWFGAHPDDPSPTRASTLDAVIAADPVALLGAGVIERFGPRLPFLLKVLAADKPLSIQVHPTRAQAEAGFLREDGAGIARDAANRNYRDRHHKPELLCALTEFEALCGFRAEDEIRDLFAVLDLPGVDRVWELLVTDGLRAAFEALLTHPDPRALVDAAVANASRLRGRWYGAGRAVALAAEHFPGDIGVVLTLFLNYVRLDPGQAIYLGAGAVHAYLCGVGVEIMASSDNVLRCGLTPKHVDVGEVLAVCDFAALPEPRLSPVQTGHALWNYPVPVDDFSLSRIDLDGYDGDVDFTMTDPAIVLCTSGQMVLHAFGESVELLPGRAVFVPPSDQACFLHGTGEAFVASVGMRAQ